MAVERRDPLPLGRYWIDAVGDDAVEELRAWIIAHANKILVVNQEYDPGESTLLKITPTRLPSLWSLFDVKEPVPWKSSGLTKLGFPTIASPAVTTKSDTAQRPEPEHIPTFQDFAENLEAVGKAVMFFGALYVLSKFVK